jgi:hypothetical protein
VLRFCRRAWRWLTHDVKRRRRWWWQRRTRGWDDRELWNLDWEIAKFVLPRLKAFAESMKRPECDQEWQQIMDDMVYAFEVHAKEPPVFDADWGRRDRGLKHFAEHYGCLWI